MKVILPLGAVDLGGHLVGADVLGDATRLARLHVGVPDRVEQLGLAVVDVTHHGHHRRPGHQVVLGALVLAELDVERLEQLAVLFLGRDHLHVVVELGPEQLQRLVVNQLGRGHHLTEVEHDLNQRGRVGPDLVGEIAQRRAPRQPDDLPVAARNLHAADRRRLHVVELLAPLLLRLPAAGRTAARAPEGSLRATPAPATATGTRRAHPCPDAHRRRHRHRRPRRDGPHRRDGHRRPDGRLRPYWDHRGRRPRARHGRRRGRHSGPGRRKPAGTACSSGSDGAHPDAGHPDAGHRHRDRRSRRDGPGHDRDRDADRRAGCPDAQSGQLAARPGHRDRDPAGLRVQDHGWARAGSNPCRSA